MAKVFFPQALLDHCVVEGLADIQPGALVLIPFERTYVVEDYVRIVDELAGQADPHGFIGKVKRKKELEELGAEIVEDSMLLGDNAYTIVNGFAGTPNPPHEEWLTNAPDAAKQFSTEDNMLRAFLAKAGA